MKVKKIISVIVSLAVVTSVLAGCGSKAGEGNGSTGESVEGTTTLKISVWDKDKTIYLQPIINAYEAKNENVKIELIDISSSEYQDKLSVMLSGGSDDIDIITVKDTPGYTSMSNKNQLEPLTSYIEKDKVDLDLYSGVAEQLEINDELYAIPFRSDFWVLYYNKNIFDNAGIDYPTNDMTWNEYEALARSLASGSGADAIYGTHYHTWRSTVQLAAILDGNNSIIQEGYSFLEPTYEMVLGMQKDKVVMDYASLKTGSIHYSGVFENEQVAMMPMGSWYMGTVSASQKAGTTNANWGIVKYPHAEGVEPGTTLGTITSLGINASSTKKDAAWDFIKFFSSEEGAKIIADNGTMPAIKTDSIIESIALMDGFPEDENSKEALNTVKTYLEMPVNSKAALIEIILNEEHDLIMTSSVEIKAGLEEMGKRVTEELNK